MSVVASEHKKGPVNFFMECWQKIKAMEGCSTKEAMRRAQDRFPAAYEEFLQACPRRRR